MGGSGTSGRWAARWLGRALGLGFRLLAATWRVRRVDADLFERTLREGPAILACWHAEQLGLLGTHLGRGFQVMVSLSRDGELLAGALPVLGLGAVRGSSSRGGREALEACAARLTEGRSVALAVDGPRGPQHEPKAGAAVLAARVGRPILLLSAEVRPAARLRSWDRLEIPWPLARVRIRYARLEAPEDEPAEIAAKTAQIREGLRALSGRVSTPP